MADESQTQSEPQAPSDDNDVLLTYEEMFKHRYTDSDADYVKTLEAPSVPPPCVENWYTRPKRSFDWAQRQDNRNRDYHGRHEGHGNRDRRDYNRDHYESKDYRHRRHDDRDDHSGGEHRNKYYRGGHGRGHRY